MRISGNHFMPLATATTRTSIQRVDSLQRIPGYGHFCEVVQFADLMPIIFQNNLTCSYNMPCPFFCLESLLVAPSFQVPLHEDGQNPVWVATVDIFQEDSKNQIVMFLEFWLRRLDMNLQYLYSWPSPPGRFWPESVHVNNKQKNGRRRKAERQEPERRTHAQLLFLLVQAKWEHCEGLTLQRPKKDADAKSRQLHFL